jgi:type IV pilus assembly protein PilO
MTPTQRLLFALPAGIGGLVAAGLAVFVLWPQWQQAQTGHSRAAELRALEAQLPRLARQVEQEQAGVVQAQKQKAFVLQLIAGSGTLATFLAEVDRIAAASGVTLALFEPLSAEPPAQVSPDKSKASGTPGDNNKDAPQPPADPLQATGLRKDQLLLSAKGRYPALLAFLRGLEKLNVLLVQSNLQLGLEEPKDRAKAPLALPVILKMSVATYSEKAS